MTCFCNSDNIDSIRKIDTHTYISLFIHDTTLICKEFTPTYHIPWVQAHQLSSSFLFNFIIQVQTHQFSRPLLLILHLKQRNIWRLYEREDHWQEALEQRRRSPSPSLRRKQDICIRPMAATQGFNTMEKPIIYLNGVSPNNK